MVEVCDRVKTKEDMLSQTVEQYKEVYIQARENFNKVVTVSTLVIFTDDNSGLMDLEERWKVHWRTCTRCKWSEHT